MLQELRGKTRLSYSRLLDGAIRLLYILYKYNIIPDDLGYLLQRYDKETLDFLFMIVKGG